MSQTHFYEVSLRYDGERKGTMQSPILHTTIEVATPPEFPNGMPDIWSPEHLLVAAVESCVMTTFLVIAENSKLVFHSFKSNAIGKLEMVDGKYMISEIVLSPVVEIDNEAERSRAERVLIKSEAACLISNSVKSTIVFEPQVIVLQPI